MTKKTYKTAMGKVVDMGSLLLQNENVRAVGNMNVNARGDLVDGTNRVIDQKNHQVQRQYKRQAKASNVKAAPVYASEAVAEAIAKEIPMPIVEENVDLTEVDTVAEPATLESAERGGLAAAIARAKTVKQELEKTARQKSQEQALKRI